MSTNLYIKAQAPSTSGEWVRPSEWLPLPTFAPTDNRVAILMAIYENDLNYTTIAGAAGMTVDWGDGTNTTTNGGYQTKEYDYNSLSSSVNIDEFGKNYKQVIINFYIPNLVSANLIRLERNGTGFYVNKPSNYLDIKAQSNTLSTFDIFFNRRAPLFKSIDLSGLTVANVYTLTNLTAARYLSKINLNYNLSTSYNSLYAYNQLITDFGNLNSIGTSFNSFFGYSNIKKIGNIDIPNATSVGGMLIACDVREVGYFYAPLATTVTQVFRDCYNLTKLGNITISSSALSLQEMFFNTNVEEIVFTNSLSSVTNTSNFVGTSFNIKRLVTPGLTRGVSLPSAKMSATALNEFFNSLGTASGSQTITITGNPGAATCNTSIATNKGYTVVI